MTYIAHITGPPRKRQAQKKVGALTTSHLRQDPDEAPPDSREDVHMTDDSTVAPARANPQQMTSSTPAVIEPEIDHAARNALLKIAGHACDLQNLIDIASSANAEDYQRDAATSAARGLATLIGATCVAATSDSPSLSINVWLLGGQA